MLASSLSANDLCVSTNEITVIRCTPVQTIGQEVDLSLIEEESWVTPRSIGESLTIEFWEELLYLGEVYLGDFLYYAFERTNRRNRFEHNGTVETLLCALDERSLVHLSALNLE